MHSNHYNFKWLIGHFKLRSEDIMDDDDEKTESGLLTED